MPPVQALLLLPARLRARGLTVVEMPGWAARDTGDGPFRPVGIIDHHDAMGLDNANVPVNMTRTGQAGAQLWVRRNGDVYMLAAGRMWHAGKGPGFGDIPADSGNTAAVGIETDYAGTGPWPAALLVSWRVLRHELAKLLGITPALVGRRLAGHKEYAPGRKIDPGNLDMQVMRAQLTADLAGTTPPPPPPPPLIDGFGMASLNDLVSVLRSEGVSGAADTTRVVAALAPYLKNPQMRLVQTGDSNTVWLVDFGAHTKWHVPTMQQVEWLRAVGIQDVSGAQAPWTIDGYRDITDEVTTTTDTPPVPGQAAGLAGELRALADKIDPVT